VLGQGCLRQRLVPDHQRQRDGNRCMASARSTPLRACSRRHSTTAAPRPRRPRHPRRPRLQRRPRRHRHRTPRASTSAIGRESSTGRRSRQLARSSPS
jgi:hypothetical protein